MRMWAPAQTTSAWLTASVFSQRPTFPPSTQTLVAPFTYKVTSAAPPPLSIAKHY